MNSMSAATLPPSPVSPELRPRILFVGAFPNPGNTVIGGMLVACRALLASSLPKRATLVPFDVTQRKVPPDPVMKRAWWSARRIRSFARLLSREEIDVLVSFSSGGLSLIEKSVFARMAGRRGIPTLLWIRDGNFMSARPRSALWRWFARVLLQPATQMLCQGELWREFYSRTLGIPESRCTVIENWLSDESILAIGKDRKYQRSSTVTLLYLGWMESAKGAVDLFDAFRSLCSDTSIPAIRVVFAGDGRVRQRLETQSIAAGLGDRISFAGWVDDQQKRRLLREADVFVLPSHAEGLPNALVEAMAAGLPSVVTTVGAIPNIVTHGREGLLVAPRDHRALIAAIRQLSLDENLRRAMGEAAYAMASKRFSVERAVNQLLAAVAQVQREYRPESPRSSG